MTTHEPGRRRHRAPRELTDRHRNALVYLLGRERTTGRQTTERDLTSAIGKYATNTIDSLVARGYVRDVVTGPNVDDLKFVLTPLGQRIATELLEHAQQLVKRGAS